MKINIPTPLRAYTGGQQTVTVPGATVAEALQALTAAYADLRQNLYTPRASCAPSSTSTATTTTSVTCRKKNRRRSKRAMS